jgi:hypothetical protein
MKFPKKLKKNKGVYSSHHSTEFDNIFVVDQSLKNSPRVNFPVVAPDPEKFGY